MPHLITWASPQRLCLVTIKGQIEVDELTLINQDLQAAILEGVAPLHFIIDITALDAIPMALAILQQKYPLRDSKVGWIVLIGGHPVFRFLIGVVTSTKGAKFHKASSLEAAYDFLKTVDETINAVK